MTLIIADWGKKKPGCSCSPANYLYVLLFYQNLHPNVMIGNLSSFDIA